MDDTTMPTPDLAIIIVNYNTSALLRDCLCSLYASDTGGLSVAVCVVDNASPDDSVAMVRAEFPQAHLIANAANVGYPQANNQGLRYFGFTEASRPDRTQTTGLSMTDAAVVPGAGMTELPDFALLLNPDTVLPPRALAEMVAFMAAHPRAGAAGPKLIRLDGSLDWACRRSFPTPESSLYHLAKLDRLFPRSPRFARYDLRYLDPDVVTRVDAIVGAFMLVRRAAIVQAGLLDETFFMYGEDLDWAKRITDCGWEVWYNPAVTVTHVKEAASRHSYRARVEFYRALTIFYEKHYRATTAFWMDWLIRGGIFVFGQFDLFRRRRRGNGPATNRRA
jgi:GT2 family glycosyltransferase